MKYEILGFNQAEVIKYGLDLVDLTLLNYVWSMSSSPSTEKIHGEDNLSYVWLYHKKVLFDLPILNIQEEALKKRFAKLIKLGMLNSIVKTNIDYGRKAFYAITQLCETLVFTQVYSNTLQETRESVENNASVSKYPSDKNISNNNTKIDISNTIQQELFTDKNINNKEVINKEDTYKEKAEKFVADYNEICVSLPKCRSLTDGRTKKIIKLLKKYSYDDILTVFKKLEESDFCTNRGGKGWKANIDFILSEDNFVKTLEGKYDNRNKRSGTGKSVEVTSLKDGEVARVVTQEEKEELRRMVERGELEEY